ncbi:MAG: hypothetical protein PHC61_12505, partial [Chitinivibrionales bacterium]|nr:hypothetical protein [Chitinivibrionales bacterium]
MKNFAFCGVVVLVVALNLWAVDGIAVAVRNWTGYTTGNGATFDGDIYRIDIKNSDTVKSTKLVSGPAEQPHISPDGKRVAFIKTITPGKTGMVCVISIDGGTITELCQCHFASCLDFPNNNWIYWINGSDYNLSAFPGNGDSTDYVFRVNANGGMQRELVTILKYNNQMVGNLGEGIAVDTGLTRCCT